MIEWYSSYFSQTWYANTFLVRRPNQIARSVVHDYEWNNIYDSGCNFCCMAMILDIDPARLASELGKGRYFFADRNFPAKRLDGSRKGLVWDQNAPHEKLDTVHLIDFWHQTLKRRVSITLRFITRTWTSNYQEGCNQVNAIYERGHHVICGPEVHSYLIAGEKEGDYFVWDPNGSKTTVEENIAGTITLRHLFNTYSEEGLEFWEYSTDFV